MAAKFEDRLEKLKQLRAEELASKKPSCNYIQDLDQSIIDESIKLQRAMLHGVIPYVMVN